MYDLFIIGGGINGVGVAHEAGARGMRVGLAEMGDLAGATSSASTKLIHGGLRYLEYYEFRLVREALREREVLLSLAPHIIWPMRFVLPHHKDLRPAGLIRLGLFLYDHIGGRRKLPKSKRVKLDSVSHNAIRGSEYSLGFEYSDCWVDDARLVVLNAMQARDAYGVDIMTRMKVTHVVPRHGHWHITCENQIDGVAQEFTAKAIVNAGGPWVHDVLSVQGLSDQDTPSVRLVKGSHIIIKRHFEGDHAYIFQNGDGRVVFAIPYEDDFTLIGTTEIDYKGDPRDVKIAPEEIDYLLDVVNGYFETSVRASDIVHDYAGVRPLLDDGEAGASAVTRDYTFHWSVGDVPPLLSIFGGKITTYRKLAKKAVDEVVNKSVDNYKKSNKINILKGGLFDGLTLSEFTAQMYDKYPQQDSARIRRLARNYGTAMDEIIARGGDNLGGGLFTGEVDYLIEHEFALRAEDILWRRTKLGLHVNGDTVKALERYLHD